MNKIIIMLFAVIILAGCAQAIKDYQTGQSTPLVNGEVSPATQASTIQAAVASVPFPFAGVAAPIVGFLATIFFTWQRGVGIRKNNGVPSAAPVASVNIFTTIVQDAASVFAGAFTTISAQATTTTGSVIQRIWKTALAVVASGVAVATADPTVASYLTGHPITDAIFVAVSSGIMGLEKGLSNVPTVAVIPPTTSA